MARKKAVKDSISTEAIINQIHLRKTEHEISFSSMKIKEGDSEFIQDVVDNESNIEVAICYPGPEDKKFPPIVCNCGMKGLNIKKTVDKPAFINMRFSGDQIDKLRNIMEAETEIILKIKRLQGTFNFDESDAGGDTDSD
jgi:hypothetical protein